MFNRISNYLKLKHVQHIVNKYRIVRSRVIRLKYKPLLKRERLTVVSMKINKITAGLIVTSKKKSKDNVVIIDYMWINRRKFFIESEINAYYEALFSIYMQWFVHYFRKSAKGTKITLTLFLNDNEQVENLRRILTLHGFSVDIPITFEDIEFQKPYREEESIMKLVYSRILS